MPVSLRQLGQTLLFLLLFALLGFHIVRSAADLWLSPCPAYDGITHRAAYAAIGCQDQERGQGKLVPGRGILLQQTDCDTVP